MKKSFKKTWTKFVSLALVFLLFSSFTLFLTAVKTNAAETETYTAATDEISFGNGSLLVTQTEALTLDYDDYYSFSNSFPGYRVAGIVNEQIDSYQVSKGEVLPEKDASVISRDGDSVDTIVATGVGNASVYLTPSNSSSTASQIINRTYNGNQVQIDTVRVDITVSPATLTLMFLAGQSNMEGYCSNSTGYKPEDSVLCNDGQVYSTYASKGLQAKTITGISSYTGCTLDNYTVFVAGSLGHNAKNYEGEELIYPLNALTSRGNGKTGPDSGLAYEWNKLTGEKVWTVNAAWGGSKIESWAPLKGTNYLRASAVFEAALKTYEAELEAGHYLKGHRLFFWLQGESDRKTALQDYQDRFNTMYSEFQQNLKFEKLGIISVRASTGSFLNSDDLFMTAPRISQYYMASSRDEAYRDIYIASNVNEQWVSDEQVCAYFEAAYPEGKFDYPLRENTTLTSLPKTMNEVHSDIHYAQVGHNENGITAADNMYKIVSGESTDEISFAWLGADGIALDTGSAFSCAVNQSAVLVPSVQPVYMSKAFTYTTDTSCFDYDAAFGRIVGRENGDGSLQAIHPDGFIFSSQVIEITGSIASPNLLTVSNSVGGVSLKWQSSVNATGCGYYIYRTTNQSKWGAPIDCIPANIDDSVINYTDSTAKSGVFYYYTVKAYCGDNIMPSDTVLGIQYIQYPILKTISNTATGVKLTWEASAGAEGYRVYRYMDNKWHKLVDVDASTTSYTDTNVVGGDSYLYTVRCISADSKKTTSAYDANGIKTTYITAPVLKSATNTTAGVKVTWQTSKGAEKYRVFRYEAGHWKKLGDVSASATSYTDTNVESSTQYRYTVRCISADAKTFTSSYDSNGITVTYIAAPVLKSATSTNSGVKITWQTSKGAEKYRVFRHNGTSWVNISEQTGTSFTDTNVEYGVQYRYTVRCVSADGKTYTSAYDNNGITVKYVAAPVLKSATSTNSGVKITWQTSKGAEKYRVFRYEAGHWTKLGDVSAPATSYTDTNVESGSQYRYTVRCVSADGKAYASAYDNNGITVKYIAAPVLKSATSTNSGVKITWLASNGAEKYRVYRHNGTSWVKISEQTETSFTDANVESGMQYRYTVRCVSADGKAFTSAYDSNGVTVEYIAAPVLKTATSASTGVKITWQASIGAENYRVYRHNGSTWVKLADVTETSFIDTSVESGTQYRYTVRCVSANGAVSTSSYDGNGITVAYIAAPVLKSATSTNSGVKITWLASNGAEKYRVYRHNGTSWVKISEQTGTSFTDANVESGMQYRYTVRCVSADGKTYTSSYDSNGITVTYIAAPVLKSATSTNSGVKITWLASNGAEKYRVFRHNGTSWVKISEQTGTSFTDANVESGMQYRYTVRCVSADGKTYTSAYDNNGITVTYIAAPVLKSATSTNSGVKITWQTSSGAEKYRVFRYENGHWTKLADVSASTTSYTDSTVADGTAYLYTVRCVSADGKSFTSDYDRNGIKVTYVASRK